MHKRNSLSPGFTIVELLIVIVVIAILAAISVVAYRGLQDRARASEVSSALTQSKKKLELYKVDNGSYPTTGNLASAGITSTDGSFQYTSDGSTFCLTATSGTVSYLATNTTNPTQGGCAGHGQGGVAAITNLSPNPSFETNTSGVSTIAFATLAREPTGGAEGGASLKATRTSAGDAYFLLDFTGPEVVTPSTPYTLSFWIWGDTSATLVGTIEFRRNSSAGQDRFRVMSPPSISTTPQRIVMSGTTSAASSTGGLQFAGRLPGTIGASVYFDGFMVTQGSSQYSYADGNSPNWTWNGTAHASTSTGPSL